MSGINGVTSVKFSAGKYTPKEVKKQVIFHIVRDIALSILTGGLYAIGLAIKIGIANKIFMPATFNKRRKRVNIEPEDQKIKDSLPKVQIKTFDGVKLDAREVKHFPNSNKWVAFFGGNGYWYENHVRECVNKAHDLGLNVLLFNYRDISESKGYLTDGYQLTVDGSAVVDYLKHHHQVKEEDILLYGHSQGGGVVAQLKSIYKSVKIVSDRSYSTTSKVGTSFAKGNCLKGLLECISKCFRYHIDAHKHWKKAPEKDKVIIYHKDDQVIDYRQASLYYADLEHKKKNSKFTEVKPDGRIVLKAEHKGNRIRLKNQDPHPHNYPIHEEPEAYQELIQKVKVLMGT